ncbi:MAG: hypothetical protein N3E52_03785 [Candidatus Bathyarchaeota archaeon]|nr:hypothetical protein [Candidatus Bathyarchaeota archaeon]
MIGKKISKTVGLMQAVIGGASMFFAFFLFYNVFSLQEILGASDGHIWFYLWILIIFGLLSVISGLLLFFMSNKRWCLA